MQSKERNSNIELFRIVMMLSIVAHHYVVNSGLLEVISEPPYSWRNYFLFLFGMWGKIGINCFVLITGYFMCKSEITIRKFLKLYLEVIFYLFIGYVSFAAAGYDSFSIGGLLKAINPMGNISHDFTWCFLVYYLLIPFLNILVNNLSKKMHRTLIVICVMFFSVWDSIPGLCLDFNYVQWFCILHVIAAYIRFYIPNKSLVKNKSVILVILAGVGVAMLSVIFQCYIASRGISEGRQYRWVVDSNAIIGLLSSVMLFVGFKDLHIPNKRWINVIASSTFGVLLIHANSDTMRHWLWRDVLDVTGWWTSPYMPLHAICSVVGIFLVCVFLDQLRINLIERPLFKCIDDFLKK